MFADLRNIRELIYQFPGSIINRHCSKLYKIEIENQSVKHVIQNPINAGPNPRKKTNQ